MVTFMNLTKSEFRNTFMALQNVHENVKHVAQSLSLLKSDETMVTQSVLSLVEVLADAFENMSNEQKILRDANRWLRSSYALTSARLSVDLIPVQDLQKELNNIAELLRSNYKGVWRLQRTRAADYYQRPGIVTYGRKKNQLMVHVEIPLESMGSLLDLFRITVFPVPLNNSSTNTSRLTGTTEFLAVSRDRRYFIDISASMLASCTKIQHYYSCPLISSSRSVDYPSCSLAVFHGNTELIMKLCGAVYGKNSLVETVITIPEEPYVLITSRAKKFIKRCADRPEEEVPACGICLYPLECSCSLIFKGFWEVSPRIGRACFNGTSPSSTTVYHGFNAKYLSFFKKWKEHKLTTISYFKDTPLPVDEIDLKIIGEDEGKWEGVVQTHETFNTDLDKVMTRATTDQQSFATRTDALHWDSIVRLASEYANTWWVKYALVGAVSLIILGFIFIFWKMRSFSVSLAMLGSMLMGTGVDAGAALCTYDSLTYFNCSDPTQIIGQEFRISEIVHDVERCKSVQGKLGHFLDKVETNDTSIDQLKESFGSLVHELTNPHWHPDVRYANISFRVNYTAPIETAWYQHPYIPQAAALVVFVTAVIMVLMVIWGVCKEILSRCSHSRFGFKTHTMDLGVGFARAHDFQIIHLAKINFQQALLIRDIEIYNFDARLESGWLYGRLKLTWSPQMIATFEDLNLKMPTEAKIMLPKIGSVASLIKHHTFAALYIGMGRIHTPIVNSRFPRINDSMDNSSVNTSVSEAEFMATNFTPFRQRPGGFIIQNAPAMPMTPLLRPVTMGAESP